jgi:hypothetical protein
MPTPIQQRDDQRYWILDVVQEHGKIEEEKKNVEFEELNLFFF